MILFKKSCLKFTAVSALAFAFAACATEAKKEEPQTPSAAYERPATQESGGTSIDIEALSRSLHLTKPFEILGYEEASFNTCQAGYGYSSSRDCQRMTLAVIHVRLQCRDSEGTISTALGASDLRAVAGQGVRWTLMGQDGIAQSDGEGYAEIRAIFPRSPRTQRLRLAVGVQFLYVRANEVTRIVTPRPWCHADER